MQAQIAANHDASQGNNRPVWQVVPRTALRSDVRNCGNLFYEVRHMGHDAGLGLDGPSRERRYRMDL